MDNETNMNPEQNAPVVEKKDNIFKKGGRWFKRNWKKIAIGAVATGAAALGGAYALKKEQEKSYQRGRDDQYDADLDLFTAMNRPEITDGEENCCEETEEEETVEETCEE